MTIFLPMNHKVDRCKASCGISLNTFYNGKSMLTGEKSSSIVVYIDLVLNRQILLYIYTLLVVQNACTDYRNKIKAVSFKCFSIIFSYKVYRPYIYHVNGQTICVYLQDPNI